MKMSNQIWRNESDENESEQTHESDKSNKSEKYGMSISVCLRAFMPACMHVQGNSGCEQPNTCKEIIWTNWANYRQTKFMIK